MKTFYTVIILVLTSVSFAQNQLWGVNSKGGTSDWGTIYKMDTDGSDYTVMHHFDFTLGGTPMGSLSMASDGNLYGTCFDGGEFFSCTIYRFDPDAGIFTHLWDFDVTSGDFPMGGVVDYNNKVYGFAWSGGSFGVGVIYNWDYVAGTYNVVHDFDGTNDGSSVVAEPLLIGSKLYGVASGGGVFSYGTLFEYDIDSDVFTTLHSFDLTDGSNMASGVILGDDGHLYGTSFQGGSNNKGTVYRYNLSASTFELLYDFEEGVGINPRGKLMEGTDGLMYGTTTSDTIDWRGTIYSFDPATSGVDWLHLFNGVDGQEPWTDLTQSGDLLLGTTYAGGSALTGVQFSYDLATSSYVKLRDLTSTTGTWPMYGSSVLVVDPAAEISENNSGGVRLYPTVSDGNIYLSDFSEGKLEIVDVSGKICYASNFIGPYHELNLNLLSGSYFWRFEDVESGMNSGRLVIR